ncbi:MAG TPA: hypothetical protein VIH57_14860 [Bacteroidales bacterium]
MNLILTIAFNSLITSQVKIENPPHIPDIGDIVEIIPEDYFSNENEIKILREYGDGDIWKVGFKTITYEKDKVSVLTVLEERKHFEEHQKRLLI